jgi:hypothetical protein
MHHQLVKCVHQQSAGGEAPAKNPLITLHYASITTQSLFLEARICNSFTHQIVHLVCECVYVSDGMLQDMSFQ